MMLAKATSRSRGKACVILASAAAHLALLVVLLRAPGDAPPVADADAISVSLLDGHALLVAAPPPAVPPAAPPVSSASPAEAEPEPVQPSDVEPQYVEIEQLEAKSEDRDPSTDPVALSVAAAAQQAAGEACRLGEWLQQALQADPQVQAAIPRIPRRERSVANALMVWNGQWVAMPAPVAPSVATIRNALIAGIRSAPASCQHQLVRGPELLILTGGADATVIALGSGEWRWMDLIDPPAQPGLGQASAPVA